MEKRVPVKIRPIGINIQEIKPIVIKVPAVPIVPAVIKIAVPVVPQKDLIILKKSEDDVKFSTDGLIKLPYFKTAISPPPPKPVIINYDSTDLALAQDRRQKASLIFESIDFDMNKLQERRASDKSIYSLEEIKDLAEKLGIKKSQPKPVLISEIKKIYFNYKSETLSPSGRKK